MNANKTGSKDLVGPKTGKLATTSMTVQPHCHVMCCCPSKSPFICIFVRIVNLQPLINYTLTSQLIKRRGGCQAMATICRLIGRQKYQVAEEVEVEGTKDGLIIEGDVISSGSFLLANNIQLTFPFILTGN